MDAPSEAKAQALAKPIPDEAPTTNAFFPVSLKEGITGRPVTSWPYKNQNFDYKVQRQ